MEPFFFYILVLFVIASFAMALVLWLFKRWLDTRRSKKKPTKEKNIMFGFDLDQYHYLGFAELHWSDSTDKPPVFFFCRKDDPKKRGVYTTETARHHNVYLKYYVPWSHGEEEIWKWVKHPSEYLKEYCLNVHDSVWDIEKKWWVKANQEVKYKNAKKKQDEKANTTLPITAVEQNVVTLDFGKKDEPNK